MSTANLGLKNDHVNGDPLQAVWANDVADDLDAAHAAIITASISVGAEAGNVIAVTVQVKNLAGNNIAAETPLEARLVDTNSKTAATTSDPPSGGWAAGVGLLKRAYTANVDAAFVTNSSGVLRIDITEAAADTWYLVVDIAGKTYISPAITFV